MQWFILGSCCLLCGLLPELASAEAHPRIVVAQVTADLGKCYAGVQIPITYQVDNQGQGPLQILNVGAGCGCLAPQRHWPERLDPGKSGTISLTVETHNMAGSAHYPLTVFSNDPDNPKLTLWIKAEVEPILSLEPSRLDFGDVPEASAAGSGPPPAGALRQMIVRNCTAQPLPVALPTTGLDPRFILSLRETEPGRSWILEARLAGPLVPGLNAMTIPLTTGHPGLLALPVGVSAWRPPPVQVIPPKVLLGSTPLRQEQPRKLVVRSQPGQSWKVSAATCSDPRLQVGPPTQEDGLTIIPLLFPAAFAPLPDCGISLTCQGPAAEQVILTIPIVAPAASAGR